MIRRTLRKVVPTYAILPMCLTALTMAGSYGLAKVIQFFFAFEAIDITSSLDALFSFEPAWIWAYFGSYFFWIYQYTAVARESAEKACQIAVADAAAKMICLAFFIFLPATNTRPEITGNGISDHLMRLLYWIDTPTNLFPSMHCFVAWMGTRYIFECKKMKHKRLVCLLCFFGTVLVFLSTLYTKQHVVWDVLSGVAVAEIGYVVARFSKLPQWLQKYNERFIQTKLCKYL